MRWSWWLPVLLAGFVPLRAEPAAPAIVEAHYREVAQRPEFQETADLDLKPSWQDRVAQWLRHFGSSFDQLKYAPQMSRLAAMLFTGLTLVAVIGVLYVSARLLRRRLSQQRTREPVEAGVGPNVFAEPDLAQTVAEGRWRAAWLIAWRQFLGRLEESGLAAADRTRTNREYLAQLEAAGPPAPAMPLLREMVEQYDATIYGDRPVDEPTWRRFRDELGEASLLLHLRDAKAAEKSR